MNIKTRVLDILKQTNTPVYYATNYEANDDTFIIFFINQTKTHSCADDEEASIYYHINVQIISVTDYDDLADNIIKLMRQANFKRLNEADTYDADLGFYTKAIQFSYVHFL